VKSMATEPESVPPRSAARLMQGTQPVVVPAARRAAAGEPPRLSRRERRKIATREALIKAAEEVIAIKGAYLAVIEEITERADVAKGSFYQYFRDRDDLLQVLLTRRLEELRLFVDARPLAGTLAERLRALIRHHLVYFLQHEDFLLFLHQIRGLIKMKGHETPAVREAYRRHLTFLAESLRADGAKLPGNKKIPEEGACVLFGILTGFLSHYAILAPLKELTADRERIETALTNACLGFWQDEGGRLSVRK
jgi:AcrR family transcriptional regulator